MSFVLYNFVKVLHSKRNVSELKEIKSFVDLEPKEITTAINDCDTDADTCCLGVNFVVLEPTRREADVYG